MRISIVALGVIGAGLSSAASAATIVIYTDPMTMERRTVVVDSDGPDRAFVCQLPPGDAGCRQISLKRERR